MNADKTCTHGGVAEDRAGYYESLTRSARLANSRMTKREWFDLVLKNFPQAATDADLLAKILVRLAEAWDATDGVNQMRN